MAGYATVSKNKTVCLKDIVAIVSDKGEEKKSRIISKKGDYYSTKTSKKIAERLESGKKKKAIIRKKI